MASEQGVDAHGVPDQATAAQLKQDGFSYVAQYIDQNDADEVPGSTGFEASANGPANGSLTAAEAQQISAAGVNIVSIFETNGEAVSPYYGASNSNAEIVAYLSGKTTLDGQSVSQGFADGKEALASAAAIGQPVNSAIYFALDFDPGPGSFTPGAQQAVETYLRGVSQALTGSGYEVGVYGAGQTLQWATTADPANGYVPDVSYTWLSGSSAWAGYDLVGPNGNATTHGWSMIQAIPGVTTSQPSDAPGTSLPVDYDTTASDDFGAFAVTCYASGTRIRTARGDVAVERLAIGDLVVTSSGDRRPIRWIGHRTIDCGRFRRRDEALPVRIAAHAFGAGRPSRDLLVSPGHAICVDILGEALIPAAALVNGASVRQVEVETVTYWHIELDSHDVILAENLPAESFLDMGNRGFFVEAEIVTLGAAPDSPARRQSGFCRPVHADGPLVDAARARLLRRTEMADATRVAATSLTRLYDD